MDLMGELALGRSFGTIEDGKPARYLTLVEQSQRFANIVGLSRLGSTIYVSSAGCHFLTFRNFGERDRNICHSRGEPWRVD